MRRHLTARLLSGLSPRPVSGETAERGKRKCNRDGSLESLKTFEGTLEECWGGARDERSRQVRGPLEVVKTTLSG